jgi:cation diffusion facilitator CzcD-associated flavoprotein CzcO
MDAVQEGLSFDPAALKAKYREERDKRLRDDGIYQYREIEEGVLRHYVDDPYCEPISRPAIDEEVEFLIVGGGFGGQLLTVRLMEAGITDVRIVEKAGDFGGTWYWNRYPGAACDIESYIYMPLCEEMNYMPTEKYTRAPELWGYARKIGRHYGLYDKTIFQTEVHNLDWDEGAARWIASTNRGDKIRARFVATASGPLHKPKLPGVEGIETYKGHSFHTSRWDYDYTGGDTTGGLDKISDKRIGIIGTGATAIQAVPHLARGAKHLYVFQRTPSSVDVRLDGPTDSVWASKLTPGWQQRRMDNFNIIVAGGHQDEDLVSDGWTDILKNLSISGSKVAAANKKGENAAASSAEETSKALQMADFRKMSQIRARVDSIVKDPSTAAALKPWYNQFCKRPCFHDDYLPTFNRSNVTLVDTAGQGISHITEKGVVANDQEIELDCIVYATGFEFGTDYSQKMRTTICGRNGVALHEQWADGPRTLHGLHSRGFPNCFIISIAQSALTPNFTHMLNEQAKHIAYIVSQAKKHNASTVEVSAEAEEKWIETIIDLGRLREGFLRECTPGYYNDEGKLSEKALRSTRYGLGAPAFIKLLDDWRGERTLPGLELDGKAVVVNKAVLELEELREKVEEAGLDVKVIAERGTEIVGVV